MSEGTSQPQAGSVRSAFFLYLKVAAPVFFGLFFVEYLPLFLVGYWSWGYVVHKVLSGVFIVLNLGVAEFSVRWVRSRSASQQHVASVSS